MICVGLDVRKRVCYGTLMDKEGRAVKQDNSATMPRVLGRSWTALKRRE